MRSARRAFGDRGRSVKGFIGAWVILCACSAGAGRTVVSLSGADWTCDGEAVSVPHCWNGIDGADGEPAQAVKPNAYDGYGMSISPNTYLRKAAVYTRALPDPTPGKRQFIRFGAVSRKATVKVNGAVAGAHAGAFTAFTVEATALLKPTGNVLEVVADNRYDPDLAPLSADYTLMGGIYRDVEWLETPPTCIDPVTDGADGIVLDVNTNGTVVATVRVLSPAGDVSTVVQTFHFACPELWSPEHPKLYTVHVEIASGDAIDVPFGFRTVEFRDDGFYLNGMKRKLRGVNRHQDVGVRGWAATAAEDERDFALIKEVGADAVRLGHYPQSQRVMALCDRLGLLVWCEEPAINWLSRSASFKANLFQQAREMIAQNCNHPSIFAWSLYNEIYNSVPPDREEEGWMEQILAEARDRMRARDPSRPIVAASDRPAKRRLNDLPDALAFNAYPGWYGDTTMRQDMDNWFAASGRSMLAISEYGAGGNPFEHLDPLPSGRLDPGGPLHPEETQVKLHAQNYREIVAEPRLWGTFVWAMFDFAADARREGGKNGINDKGLVTRDRTTKKDAFYLFKANWSQEPVLHICSQRATETTNGTCTVVGFSNAGAVTLSVNGTVVGTKMPDEVKVVRWPNVPLVQGENRIALTADDSVPVATRRLVRLPAPSRCAQDPCHTVR